MFLRKRRTRVSARVAYPPEVHEVFVDLGPWLRLVVADGCPVTVTGETPDGRLLIEIDLQGVPVRAPCDRSFVRF
jgi:hypothetical protein